MAELERDLRLLAAELDWPRTPPLVLRPPTRRSRPDATALVVALAVGLAFAVPGSRGAILRFFHLGAVSVQRVRTLPSAQERSLRSALGTPTTPAGAADLLGRPFVPAGVAVYRSGAAVSAIVDGGLLLTELRTQGGAVILKKFAGTATRVESVSLVPGTPALWLTGARHVVVLPPRLPARYAGNTLVWEHDGITYRLEGAGLTLARAHAIAVDTLR